MRGSLRSGRFGAYTRPLERFHVLSKSLLFWESRFAQALANTSEIGTATAGCLLHARRKVGMARLDADLETDCLQSLQFFGSA